MKAYCGNPNSIADSILELLYDHKLCADITRKAKNKVRNEYNWSKIAQDTFYISKAICQSMAEKQKREVEQERAKKAKKLKIQRMKLQTYLISKNVKHMRKIERIIYLSINNSFLYYLN